jgi:GT2 family glycosyltransferase/glycosyltransferase involved in cell wall biosynthesis
MQLIVLGMHRSGTSVLARLLNMMGAYFGPEGASTAANIENPKGFWERQDVRELNDFVLHSVGCDWNKVAGFQISSLPDSVVDEFNTRASTIILGMDAHRPWLLKEPRLCLLFELWKDLLEVPVCIHIYRNPLEVAQSLLTRNGIPIHIGIALWEKYNQLALKSSRGSPRLVVSHNRLINSAEAEVRHIYEQLIELGVDRLRMPTKREITSFIKTGLYHERVKENKLVQHLNVRQMDVFKSFCDGSILTSKRGFALSEATNILLKDYEHNQKKSLEAEATQKDISKKMTDLRSQQVCELERQKQLIELQEQESKNALEQAQRNQGVLKKQKLEQEKALTQQINIQALEIENNRREAELARADLEKRYAQHTQALEKKLVKNVEQQEQQELKLVQQIKQQEQLAKKAKEESKKAEKLVRKIDQLELEAKNAYEEARRTASEFQERHTQKNKNLLKLNEKVEALESYLSEIKLQTLELEKSNATRGNELAIKEQTIKKLGVKVESATQATNDALKLAKDRLQDINRLVRWLHVIEFHLGSWRWRGGRLAVGTLSKMIGKNEGDINADDINKTLETFKSWEYSKDKSIASDMTVFANDKASKNNSDRHLLLIQSSGLFDRSWYLNEYPDVKESGMDPVFHYVKFGSKENRNPSRDFHTKWYLQNYPDVAKSGINPLEHYILHGRDEFRSTMPLLRLEAPEDFREKIEIVVTVYNALSDVKKCLNSIKARRDGFIIRVIVVNDGSDKQTSDWLSQFCQSNNDFQLIEHGRNEGYTKAVNSGLKASTAPYVIILNSDTIVTEGWLRGLIGCMNSDPKIGIVGPLSSAASWQNVPELLDSDGDFAVNDLPVGMTPDDMAEAVANTSSQLYPRLPFVNGFCFMIRRKVIDDIGFMDEDNFPEGYGEENDYCIRASDAGFALAIADDTYVFHAKSKSFGHERRKKLSKEGSDAIKQKHSAQKFEALVAKVKDTRLLDKVRSDLQANISLFASRENTLDHDSLKVLFLLPVRGGSGGAHSVVQEVTEMRRLGVSANIAVKSGDLEHLLEMYKDVECVDELFIGFSPECIFSISKNYNIVVGTIFSSMTLVKQIVEVNPQIVPAYYVQDYEPWFFPAGSEHRRIAYDSYKLVPNAVLFAKTLWIANIVEQKHGVKVHKVSPSIDHQVYQPEARNTDGKIVISAMIRPKTPRRGADRTMRLLSRIAGATSGKVSIQVFGCLDKDKNFQQLQRDFEFTNNGVLTRPEVAALLAGSNIFIDLSDYQAFGRTALEAMACGCAVMVPVHGGTDEYAINDVNALVVDTFNEEECFKRLDALIKDGYKLKDMQRSGLRTAADYSVNRAAKSELAVFAKFVSTHEKSANVDGQSGDIISCDSSQRPSVISVETPEEKLPITALVITWDVGHNPVGRSYMMAEVLDRIVGNVVIIGFQFPRYGDEIWEPLADSKIPIISLPGNNFPEFLQSLDKIAERFSPDIIVACKARLPSVQLGALVKDRIGCPLFIDIDDHELTFFENAAEVSFGDLEEMDFGSVKTEIEPYGKLWTGLAQYSRQFADEILVSNEALQSEFGGTCIPHVRNEMYFDPQKINRRAIRREFGIPVDARVVLFFGTPRRHKGIDLIARSVAKIADEQILLVVVGVKPGGREVEKLRKLAGKYIKFVPNQPFDRIPDIVSMADAICLPQDPSHPTSRYQLPAKAIDAIAMDIPLLVTANGPLTRLIDLGVAVEISEKTIATKLKQVLKRRESLDIGSTNVRKVFLKHFSYAAAATTLHKLISEKLENCSTNLGFDINFARFVQAQQHALGISGVKKIPRRKPGKDFVLFWKQNDSGLYGRRVDMFIKYLASRDDVRKIVVFDAPISELKLLGFRNSVNRTSHERWIYVNSYAKILGKLDSEKLSYNVYTGPSGINSLLGMELESEKGLSTGYIKFISNVLQRECVTPKDSVFWFYPRNFSAKKIINHFLPDKIAVDVVDDHRSWPGVSERRKTMLTENYRYLLGHANMVMVNCESLLDKMSEFCANIYLVPNGCDSNPPSITPNQSKEFEELTEWNGKTIGYLGNLESKIDIELIEKIALRFSDCRIILLGSTHTGSNLAVLQKLPNIRLPGVVPYEQIGAWIKLFDVGIVPHRVTELTKHMNPLKVFVYIQWGLPIVATNVENLGYEGPLIQVATTHNEFLAGVEYYLELTVKEESGHLSFVQKNNWCARFKEHIDELLDGNV